MPSDPESWVGHRFRELRKERDWSQEDLAERMKAFGYRWSQATVTRLEAATRPIRLNEIAGLAAAFGLKLTDFLAGAPAPQSLCPACHGEPPAGFTCNACSQSGAPRGERPAKKPAFREVRGVTITEPMARELVNELLPPLQRKESVVRNFVATRTALERRGLMMKPGDRGPGGTRLTEKGLEVARMLAPEFGHAAP